MSKTDNFTTSLPDGYILAKHVDAKKDKKTAKTYSLLSFVPFFIIMPIVYHSLTEKCGYSLIEKLEISDLIAFYVALLIYFVYIVLHEVTHGITYKIFTGGKLKFGLTLTVAFCGVPDLYVRKKTAVAALIMPFTVFSIIFTALAVVLANASPYYSLLAWGIFSLHIGCCVSDLHWTLMYLTKYRRCETLMRDIGPEQWLYVKQ